jgi:hypothetical protein
MTFTIKMPKRNMGLALNVAATPEWRFSPDASIPVIPGSIYPFNGNNPYHLTSNYNPQTGLPVDISAADQTIIQNPGALSSAYPTGKSQNNYAFSWIDAKSLIPVPLTSTSPFTPLAGNIVVNAPFRVNPPLNPLYDYNNITPGTGNRYAIGVDVVATIERVNPGSGECFFWAERYNATPNAPNKTMNEGEQKRLKRLQFTPNPASGFVEVSCIWDDTRQAIKDISNLRIIVLDSKGMNLVLRESKSSSATLNISALKPGVYPVVDQLSSTWGNLIVK